MVSTGNKSKKDPRCSSSLAFPETYFSALIILRVVLYIFCIPHQFKLSSYLVTSQIWHNAETPVLLLIENISSHSRILVMYEARRKWNICLLDLKLSIGDPATDTFLARNLVSPVPPFCKRGYRTNQNRNSSHWVWQKYFKRLEL